jgi:hypothetical protein
MKILLSLLSLFFGLTLHSQCIITGTYTKTIQYDGWPYQIELKDSGEYIYTFMNPATDSSPDIPITYTGKYHMKKKELILESIHFPSGESYGRIKMKVDPITCTIKMKDHPSHQYKK